MQYAISNKGKPPPDIRSKVEELQDFVQEVIRQSIESLRHVHRNNSGVNVLSLTMIDCLPHIN